MNVLKTLNPPFNNVCLYYMDVNYSRPVFSLFNHARHLLKNLVNGADLLRERDDQYRFSEVPLHPPPRSYICQRLGSPILRVLRTDTQSRLRCIGWGSSTR